MNETISENEQTSKTSPLQAIATRVGAVKIISYSHQTVNNLLNQATNHLQYHHGCHWFTPLGGLVNDAKHVWTLKSLITIWLALRNTFVSMNIHSE
jgi:hypothetical protein